MWLHKLTAETTLFCCTKLCFMLAPILAIQIGDIFILFKKSADCTKACMFIKIYVDMVNRKRS